MDTNNNAEDRAKKIIRIALWSAILLIPLLFLFSWEETFSTSAKIHHEKFGTFGDFIGGILGSFWSLCGVLLFYNALKEQRDDFKTNSNALVNQQKALEAQIKGFELQNEEFRAQTKELELTREIYKEQSQLLSQQRLDSLYFSILNIYSNVTDRLNNNHNTGNYFKNLKKEFYEEFKKSGFSEAIKFYEHIFNKNLEDLNHYFRLIYRIIKIIDDSQIDKNEKFNYIKILRSQLTENELIFIYYNAHSQYGENFYSLILKYNLLKHLPSLSKLEVYNFMSIQIFQSKDVMCKDTLALLSGFNKATFGIIEAFLVMLESEKNQDNFEESRVSQMLPLNENIIIEFNSDEESYLEIEITQAPISNIDFIDEKICGLSLDNFKKYFEVILTDKFIYSRFRKEEDATNLITSNLDSRKLTFKLKANFKLTLNADEF